ncbi:MAG: hypothetical protein R3B68_13415 [Phycisphaerales bacterium]
MGFNFQSGHPIDLYGPEDGTKVMALLQERFGADVPLGSPGDLFVLRNELAWSWCSDLARFAGDELGEEGSQQIRGVDAWNGVYVDAAVRREVLWPGDPKSESTPSEPQMVASGGGSIVSRVLGLFGIRRKQEVPPELRLALDEMVRAYGAREGESGALQVGNLVALIAEFERLLEHLGTPPTEESVSRLAESYAADDARCDDDGHIQCLCHAWLTAKHALDSRAPLWLLK